MIGRRILFIGFGAAAIVQAQAAAQRLPRIAISGEGEPVDSMVPGGHPNWSAFLTALRDLGYVEGESIVIDRWTASDQSSDGRATLAAAVVASQPDLIVTRGTPATAAFRDATSTVPIIASANLEVFAQSLARPGGNITGINSNAGNLEGKHLELLREAAPALARVAWIALAAAYSGATGQRAQAAARELEVELVPVVTDATVSETALRRAFAAIRSGSFDGILIAASPALDSYAQLIGTLSVSAELPTIGNQRFYAAAGALMSYGQSFPHIYARLANYVDRILKGERPDEMAIEQPVAYDLVVNLRTAAALGITLPPAIMIRATEIIE